MTKKSRNPSPADKQAPMTGKVENDFNKQGEQAPTQKKAGGRRKAAATGIRSSAATTSRTRAAG